MATQGNTSNNTEIYSKAEVDSGFLTTAAASDKADLVAGTVPASQLPSYVDDVEEYANLAAFPGTGEAGKLYVALDTNKVYRWATTVYVEISDAPDAAEIKTLYESNANTNGVTDAEKTALGNLSGTNTGDEVSATDTVEGIAELATQAEVNTGTDVTRIVTPDTLEDKTYGTFTGDTISDNATLKTALQELETATEEGVAGIGSVLATVTGIDGMVVGNTSLFTVPTGKEAVVRHLIIRLKTISGGGNVPKVSIGTNSTTFNNIVVSQSLSGLSTVGDAYTFVISGVFHVASAAEVITLRVPNAASYTAYTFDVDLVGYTI